MFAASHFASQILEIGYDLVISSACCNDPRSSSGFRQRANAVLIATRRRLSRGRIAVRAPLTTDDDDERRTIQDGRQSRSYMGARNMPPLLRWADTGPVAWRPPRCRGVVAIVLRCTPPGGRAVLSEVCGRFKSAFARFRHAAPRNQHPRSRISSRRLREIDHRLGRGFVGGCARRIWLSTRVSVALRLQSREV